MSSPAPETPAGTPRERCVFCGAIAIPSGPGEIEWVVTIGTDPECEHETLTGRN